MTYQKLGGANTNLYSIGYIIKYLLKTFIFQTNNVFLEDFHKKNIRIVNLLYT